MGLGSQACINQSDTVSSLPEEIDLAIWPTIAEVDTVGGRSSEASLRGLITSPYSPALLLGQFAVTVVAAYLDRHLLGLDYWQRIALVHGLPSTIPSRLFSDCSRTKAPLKNALPP